MWRNHVATSLLGLADVFCKNTGHFVNSDRSGMCPKRVCNATSYSRIAFFEKNAFLTMH